MKKIYILLTILMSANLQAVEAVATKVQLKKICSILWDLSDEIYITQHILIDGARLQAVSNREFKDLYDRIPSIEYVNYQNKDEPNINVEMHRGIIWRTRSWSKERKEIVLKNKLFLKSIGYSKLDGNYDVSSLKPLTEIGDEILAFANKGVVLGKKDFFYVEYDGKKLRVNYRQFIQSLCLVRLEKMKLTIQKY